MLFCERYRWFTRHYASILEGFEENKTKYALIPGSFKPPHKGHYAMFEYYSKMVGKNGKVVIFISDPKKAKRLTAEGKEIPAEKVKEIIDIYCKNLGNVETEIALTPVKNVYDYGEKLQSGIMIFGCSKKDDDLKRFRTIKDYYEKNYPQLSVIDPLTTAVDVTNNQDIAVSASDFRKVIGDAEKMKQFLPDHLTDTEKQQVIDILLSL